MGSWKESYSFEKSVEYWDNRCAYCLQEQDPNDLTKDHFIPRSKGGPNNKFNYVPACRPCNTSKDNHHPNKWCSDEVRAHIMRFFNWLLFKDVAAWRENKLDARSIEAYYMKYRGIREKINTRARNVRLLELLNVEKHPVHWAEQVRKAVRQKSLTDRRVRDDDGDVWRTVDGHHLLH